ncbi:unnamed protein product [Clonostachys rosea]|uniref:F-box domain-containing protein n=1 Tax=Bionectria ochroleuca TaxID=29856 RepID=A0ABY6UYW0_BIOOC|nr:unnamed protein product [Clonostachys rosea]
MNRLEVVDVVDIMPSIAESIASLQSLKALGIRKNRCPGTLGALERIANIQHLKYEMASSSPSEIQALSPLLTNSASTLKSLTVTMMGLKYINFPSTQGASLSENWKSSEVLLPNLSSLTLRGYFIDEDSIRSLVRVVNLLHLRELHLNFGSESEGQHLLLQQLARLAKSTSRENIAIESLEITLPQEDRRYDPPVHPPFLGGEAAALGHFLSSFDSLRNLILWDCFLTWKGKMEVSNQLVQGIVSHKDLRVLRFQYLSYVGPLRRWAKFAHDKVAIFVNNLPELQEFGFMPLVSYESSALDMIGGILAQGKNLTTVAYSASDWISCQTSEDWMRKLLRGMLDYEGTVQHSTDSEFIWEECSKISRILGPSEEWLLSSRNGVSTENVTGWKRVLSSDRRREVWYKLIPSPKERKTYHSSVNLTWVDTVIKELSQGR